MKNDNTIFWIVGLVIAVGAIFFIGPKMGLFAVTLPTTSEPFRVEIGHCWPATHYDVMPLYIDIEPNTEVCVTPPRISGGDVIGVNSDRGTVNSNGPTLDCSGDWGGWYLKSSQCCKTVEQSSVNFGSFGYGCSLYSIESGRVYYTPPCPSDPSCATSTCVGSTCTDSCGYVHSGTMEQNCGTRDCGTAPNGCGSCGTCQTGYGCVNGYCTLICVPDCTCASTTPIGQTCSDGCGGTCEGTYDEPEPGMDCLLATTYVDVSTNAYDGGSPPSNLVDGDLGTAWSTPSLSHPHWVKLEYGAPITITNYTFYNTIEPCWRSCGLSLKKSDDNINWEIVDTFALGQGCYVYESHSVIFSTPHTARYWQLDVTSGEHWDRSQGLELEFCGTEGVISMTCAELQVECGMCDDGTGNMIDCGDCPAPQVCKDGICVVAPMCPATWAPVCGKLNDEHITYSNSCYLSLAGATYLYDGECTDILYNCSQGTYDPILELCVITPEPFCAEGVYNETTGLCEFTPITEIICPTGTTYSEIDEVCIGEGIVVDPITPGEQCELLGGDYVGGICTFKATHENWCLQQGFEYDPIEDKCTYTEVPVPAKRELPDWLFYALIVGVVVVIYGIFEAGPKKGLIKGGKKR